MSIANCDICSDVVIDTDWDTDTLHWVEETNLYYCPECARIHGIDHPLNEEEAPNPGHYGKPSGRKTLSPPEPQKGA